MSASFSLQCKIYELCAVSGRKSKMFRLLLLFSLWLVVASREAARECRRKKKEYVKCLENRVAVLEKQNKTLIEELRALKDIYRHKAEWSPPSRGGAGTVCVDCVGVLLWGCLEDSWGFAFADTCSQTHANTYTRTKRSLSFAVSCVYKMMSMFLALNYPCATTSEIKKTKKQKQEACCGSGGYYQGALEGAYLALNREDFRERRGRRMEYVERLETPYASLWRSDAEGPAAAPQTAPTTMKY